MFLKNISMLCISFFFFFSSFSCSSDESKENNKDKLCKISCLINCNMLLKFETPSGSKYVDANGDISSSTANAKPFQQSGTAVLLSNNCLLGTANHICTINIKEVFFTGRADQSGNQEMTALGKQILQNMSKEGIGGSFDISEVFSTSNVGAWFALPQTLKDPIKQSIGDINKIPDGCYAAKLVLPAEGDIDLAIFEVKGNIPALAKGFNVDDFADEAMLKEIEKNEPIYTCGYPQSFIQITNDIIDPRSNEAKITSLPRSASGVLETNIQSGPGASGSFVLSSKTGKVVGILVRPDPIDKINVLCVKANLMKNLLETAINSPAIKERLKSSKE